MGMKVAAVALLCQDERVFSAMWKAGTPCPYNGKIGDEAKAEWISNAWERPDRKQAEEDYLRKCMEEINPFWQKGHGVKNFHTYKRQTFRIQI